MDMIALLESYNLLTYKPVIYVANVSEGDLTNIENASNYQKVVAYAKEEGNEVIPVSAEIESEISQLPPEEKELFLEDLGIKESGLERVIKATYRLLNLSSKKHVKKKAASLARSLFQGNIFIIQGDLITR